MRTKTSSERFDDIYYGTSTERLQLLPEVEDGNSQQGGTNRHNQRSKWLRPTSWINDLLTGLVQYSKTTILSAVVTVASPLMLTSDVVLACQACHASTRIKYLVSAAAIVPSALIRTVKSAALLTGHLIVLSVSPVMLTAVLGYLTGHYAIGGLRQFRSWLSARPQQQSLLEQLDRSDHLE